MGLLSAYLPEEELTAAELGRLLERHGAAYCLEKKIRYTQKASNSGGVEYPTSMLPVRLSPVRYGVYDYGSAHAVVVCLEEGGRKHTIFLEGELAGGAVLPGGFKAKTRDAVRMLEWAIDDLADEEG